MCSLQHLLYPLHFKRHTDKFTSHTNFQIHDFFPQLTSRGKSITTVIAKFAASHNDTTVEINISLSMHIYQHDQLHSKIHILKFRSSANSQTHESFPHLLQQKGKNYDLHNQYNYNISTKTHGHSDQCTFSNTSEKRHFNPT